jgi:hypothetical protein
MERVIQISGGICANLHTIAVFEVGTSSTSSCEPPESWICISLIKANTVLTLFLLAAMGGCLML